MAVAEVPVDDVAALLPGDLYQPIEHHAFADRAVAQPCAERLAMILGALRGVHAGVASLVDLGCHTGWFCRAFARRGWAVVGVDRDRNWLAAAELLNALCEPGVPLPRYVLSDAEAFPVPAESVALCLSVVMYTFQRSEANGWRFLEHLSDRVPVMFMDFGGMYGHYVPFTPDTAVDEVTARTAWRTGTLLGTTAFEGRPLFMFAR